MLTHRPFKTSIMFFLKSIIKSCLATAFRLFFRIGVKANFIIPCIIIPIDGGICSQMHQYLIGETFRRKGYKVKYSLSFFEHNGKDSDGLQVRNFDLLKAFPYLEFEKANKCEAKLYCLAFNYIGLYPKSLDTGWIGLKPPRFLSGYYADPQGLYRKVYNEVFRLDANVLDADNKALYDIIDGYSVAVHVRRGDLSGYNPAYGYPVTIDYFINAVKYLYDKYSSPVFYFFSDDKTYVETQLLPLLPQNICYKLVNNGAEKGYMDLMLISRCRDQITSKGSLGKYGALLDSSPLRTVIVSKDDTQIFMLEEVDFNLVKL